MSTITTDIVAKLWNLCNVLKDDGVIYHQYVTELTYLLFLKMAKETGNETQLPVGYRWSDLEQKAALKRLEFYKELLNELGSQGTPLVQKIYVDASSFIKKAETLSRLVAQIDQLDWYSARQEGLGDLYEGLLEKNANEKKSRSGPILHPTPTHREHGLGDEAHTRRHHPGPGGGHWRLSYHGESLHTLPSSVCPR